MVITLHIRCCFVGCSIRANDFDLNAIHILSVILVSDITGQRINEWTKEEVVDIVTTTTAGTV